MSNLNAKSSTKDSSEKIGRFQHFIQRVETIGNKCPHPFLLFIYLIILVLIVAYFLEGTTFEVPGREETLVIKSLLNVEGFQHMLVNIVPNFVNFPAIGLVIPIVIAVGIGEKSGLFRTVIIKSVNSVPRNLVTAVFFFAAINGNLASDASVVIFPALGAVLYKGIGRSPLIGIIAGYAGYLCGLSANILIAGTDATAAGITAGAIKILPATADFIVHPAINWYFMMASAFVLTIVGTLVTEKIVAPMLERLEIDEVSESDEDDLIITEDQNRGLKYAGVATLV